jgi:ATP-dependent RNA helicase MSS116
MSEVQKRVLKMMPQLAGQKLRGVARQEAEERGEKVDVEEGREWEGRQDLLVKAKTGTGKTLVCLLVAAVGKCKCWAGWGMVWAARG